MFLNSTMFNNTSPALTKGSRLWKLVTIATLVGIGSGSIFALTTITGVVEASGKYLVTGAPVSTTASSVLKISFENDSPGTNLELCAGTAADFTAGACPVRLSDSGGPGFVFLTIVDALELAGKHIYVLRVVGTAPAKFTLTIE